MEHTSFWRQLGNSFLPMNYGEFEYADKASITSFLRKFAIIVYAVIVGGYLFSVLGGASEVNGGKAISEEDGYYYRVKDGQLQIDEPIFIDDPGSGIYVNITDEVESFDDDDELMAIVNKGYDNILLISRTNRVKATKVGSSHYMTYTDFDDMETIGWEADNTPSAGVDGKLIAVMLAVGVVFIVVYPFLVRLSALILSLIAKLFCMLFRLDTDSDLLRTFCVYAFIPAQILILIAYAALSLIHGAEFLQSGGSPVYTAVRIIAAVLPLVLTMAAAFADKKRNYS